MSIVLPTNSQSIEKTEVNDSGLTALIQNLARDCAPTQYLREFVSNSIEACLKVPEGEARNIVASKIPIEVLDPSQNQVTVEKLCILDSGIGMSLEEMRKWLNQLSSSGPSTSGYRKYGVGAKISALTRNHAGIQYRSWQKQEDGTLMGHEIIIGYHEEKDCYGILGYPDPTDPSSMLYHKELFAEDLHDLERTYMPDGHGTMVILHGMSPTEITSNKPADVRLFGSNSSENWLVNYFHQRYFNLFDGNIDFHILINQASGKEYHTKFKGQFNVLNSTKRVLSSGQMDVGAELTKSRARLYWWIMQKDIEDKGRYFTKGHTALICENEIFAIEDLRSRKLSDFGIYVSRQRIVIYVEPLENVVQNTARTQLLHPDGNEISNWEIWQQDFKNAMPQEISDFLKEEIDSIRLNKEDSKLQERLEPYKELYSKAVKEGVKEVKPATATINGDQSIDGANGTTQSRNSNQNPAGSSSIAQNSTGTQPGTLDVNGKAKATTKSFFPEIVWLSFADFENQCTSENKECAASYDQKSRILFINKEYKSFVDTLNFFKKKYDLSNETVLAEVIQKMEDLFAMALLEAVVSIEAMPNKTWNPRVIEKALSPESLSVAVLSRHLIIEKISEMISKQFKIKEN